MERAWEMLAAVMNSVGREYMSRSGGGIDAINGWTSAASVANGNWLASTGSISLAPGGVLSKECAEDSSKASRKNLSNSSVEKSAFSWLLTSNAS